MTEKSNQTMGYISVDTISYDQSTGNCGDLKHPDGYVYGFTSEAGALAGRNTPSCYESDLFKGGNDGGMRFSYLYSAGRWQLKSVTVEGT